MILYTWLCYDFIHVALLSSGSHCILTWINNLVVDLRPPPNSPTGWWCNPLSLSHMPTVKELFEIAAEKKRPEAYGALGTMMWAGQGQDQNLTAAFELFSKVGFEFLFSPKFENLKKNFVSWQGAALNSSDCHFNLALMLAHGLGCEKNEQLAFESMKRAEALDHWKSSYALAKFYEKGIGVAKNKTAALYLYSKLFKSRGMWVFTFKLHEAGLWHEVSTW